MTAYSRSKFETVIQEKPGVCPVAPKPPRPHHSGALIHSPEPPQIAFPEPGTCADGSARMKGFERRSHGDHNPRHGGQFFMADDNWHSPHRAFYPAKYILPATFYDDFTRPLAVAGLFGGPLPRLMQMVDRRRSGCDEARTNNGPQHTGTGDAGFALPFLSRSGSSSSLTTKI